MLNFHSFLEGFKVALEVDPLQPFSSERHETRCGFWPDVEVDPIYRPQVQSF